MRLDELRIDGFGKLRDRTISFDPRFTVIYGPNEAGKSTLGAALRAALYGLGRGEKERYRPWSGARFAVALRYTLADGRTFEVQRDFERDARGIRVYDAHGNDASAQTSIGKVIAPGTIHLGIPGDVFINASYVAQGEAAIDGARAERITHSLAQALDGGPREDAALGALSRLDEALALHVGRKRATVNAPLRHLQDEIAELDERAGAMRAELATLNALRVKRDADIGRIAELEAASREHERRGRAARAYTLRTRLDALREIRAELAALATERASYDDIADFPVAAVAELDTAFRVYERAVATAAAQDAEAAIQRMTPALMAELDERETDGGKLSTAEYEELLVNVAATTAARDRATVAAEAAQTQRRRSDGGNELFGAALTAAAFVALGAGALAYARVWWLVAIVGSLAVFLIAFAVAAGRRRRGALRKGREMQKIADDALANERTLAAKVAATLEPLGVGSVDELTRYRERALALRERKANAARLAAAAAEAHRTAAAAAATFDSLAAELGVATGDRAHDLGEARRRAARRQARDGIDLRLSMLDVRRSDVLGADDEFALERELTDLLEAGVDPQPLAAGAGPGTIRSYREFEAERAQLERSIRDQQGAVATATADLRAAEMRIGDIAGVDERLAHLRTVADRLLAFERAVELAKTTIDDRTREAHRKFASRLTDYASQTFAHVTENRYREILVDPTTLVVRVRVPETGEIVEVDRLSAGTRDQAYLVVRLAMARMLSEGLEVAPLLLDDPFAYWDEERIARCMPILEPGRGEGAAQLILFTTSEPLAIAAAARGGRAIDLRVGTVAERLLPLDRDEDLPLLSQT